MIRRALNPVNAFVMSHGESEDGKFINYSFQSQGDLFSNARGKFTWPVLALLRLDNHLIYACFS